jgi:threonine dehydrogenase-like Zn-dependent dehydrogenase
MGAKELEIVADGGRARLIPFAPGPLPAGRVRVRTLYSAISAGTELGVLEASAAAGDLRRPGYQMAGIVEEVGDGLHGVFAPGDTVACYGAPHVRHASVVDVPRLLAAKGPEGVSPQHAALCGLGAIGIHAFRRAGLSLGEVAAVAGLGALGNIICQVSRAAGCRVAGLDLLPRRRQAAELCGITAHATAGELADAMDSLSAGNGADAVFLAVGSVSDELLARAVGLARMRGSVVIVGTGDARIPREQMFLNEVAVSVSRAGGEGRYDPDYEAGCRDYPYGYVRWTEGRNIAEYVRLLAAGAVTAEPLVTDVMPPGKADAAYTALATSPADHLGILFDWTAGG